MNKITIIGNIGQDPETKHINDTSQVTRISVATTERWKDKQGNKQESTQWHNCEAWNNLSKLVDQYTKKGDKVAIVGSLVYDQYEKDGVKMTAAKIKVSEVHFLTSKVDSQSSAGSAIPPQGEGDLPF